MRLEDAGPDRQLLESLLPMWEEERGRCGGTIPNRPPSPPRTPEVLCPAVQAVRNEYKVRPRARGRAGARPGGGRKLSQCRRSAPWLGHACLCAASQRA